MALWSSHGIPVGSSLLEVFLNVMVYKKVSPACLTAPVIKLYGILTTIIAVAAHWKQTSCLYSCFKSYQALCWLLSAFGRASVTACMCIAHKYMQCICILSLYCYYFHSFRRMCRRMLVLLLSLHLHICSMRLMSCKTINLAVVMVLFNWP